MIDGLTLFFYTQDRECWIGTALNFSLMQEGKTKEKLSHFHSKLPRKSAMVSCISSLVNGPSISSLKAWPRIQLSIQRLFLELFPTLHQIPLENTRKPTLIAFQLEEEGRPSGLLELILIFEQYFVNGTCAHKASFSCYMHQLSLVNKGTFLALVEWIPNPPSSFGLIIFSHLTRCIFLFSLVDTHRKFLFILSSLSHEWLGRAALCITWFGIADIIDFTKTALPGKDRNLVF